MDRVSSAQVIAESPLPLQLAGEPFSEIRNALPFRDDEAGRALRDRVDGAITTLKENGRLAEISRTMARRGRDDGRRPTPRPPSPVSERWGRSISTT